MESIMTVPDNDATEAEERPARAVPTRTCSRCGLSVRGNLAFASHTRKCSKANGEGVHSVDTLRDATKGITNGDTPKGVDSGYTPVEAARKAFRAAKAREGEPVDPEQALAEARRALERLAPDVRVAAIRWLAAIYQVPS